MLPLRATHGCCAPGSVSFCCGDRLLSLCRQDYYSSGYYQEAEAAQGAPQEMSTDSSFLDDEAVGTLLSIPSRSLCLSSARIVGPQGPRS